MDPNLVPSYNARRDSGLEARRKRIPALSNVIGLVLGILGPLQRDSLVNPLEPEHERRRVQLAQSDRGVCFSVRRRSLGDLGAIADVGPVAAERYSSDDAAGAGA